MLESLGDFWDSFVALGCLNALELPYYAEDAMAIPWECPAKPGSAEQLRTTQETVEISRDGIE